MARLVAGGATFGFVWHITKQDPRRRLYYDIGYDPGFRPENLERIEGRGYELFRQDHDVVKKEYLHRLQEAEKRDHRRFGKQRELIHTREDVPYLFLRHRIPIDTMCRVMIRLISRIITLSLLLAAMPASAQQDEFSSLEEQMTGREFRASGLDKLTEEELARLNGWIRAWARERSAGTAPTESESTRFRDRGASDEEDAEGPITSRIEGEFRGWNGDTTFQLENGQVWKQADTSTFFVNEESPQVTIEPGLFGSWYLSVEGYNTRVKVERIK